MTATPMETALLEAPFAIESQELELTTGSMGGTLRLVVATAPGTERDAERELRRVAARIEAWAARLTRFSEASDLSGLNADPDAQVFPLRPTLAAVLAHARDMAATTEGVVDVTLLDARMAAERSDHPAWDGAGWELSGCGRQRCLVRHGRSRFDLDGVAKGWIADRALRLLWAFPSALVDADGDVAVRARWSTDWSVAVEHPWDDSIELARLRLPRDWPTGSFGVATSGTSVHRWEDRAGPGHHLIDPHTLRPAVTDVIQATVVAEDAGVAESLAKAAVIRGSQDGLALLDRAGAWAAVLLLDDDQVLGTPDTPEWLA